MSSTQEEKKVIVVLGAGRSGTSLLMQVLHALGMNVSDNMIAGGLGNPKGHFEDTEIVEIHKELFSAIHAHPTLPLPTNWLDSQPALKAASDLKEILTNRLEQATTIWGFKDPRTTVFFPLWRRILNAPGIVPIFLVAVRDPASTIISLHNQIKRDNSTTELQWLQRTTDAIYNTSANCYIVHYEDWFNKPDQLAMDILEYTGLVDFFEGDINKTLENIVTPSLNRSSYEDYKVKNRYVLNLYSVLKQCKGANFNRDKLMNAVKESRAITEEFSGWYIEALEQLRKNNELKTRLETLGVQRQKIASLEKDIKQLNQENEKLQGIQKEVLKLESSMHYLENFISNS